MRRICAAAAVAGMLILLTLSAWRNHTYPSKTEMEPEYVFSYAENQPEDYPTTLGAKYFAELVEERTNGRIRILVQPVGVLGSENKVIKQMQYGGIDFARVSLAQLAEYIPSLCGGCLTERSEMRFWRVSARMMSSVCPGMMPERGIFITLCSQLPVWRI